MAYAFKMKRTKARESEEVYVPTYVINRACDMARNVVYVFEPRTTFGAIEDYHAIRHCLSYGKYVICPDKTLRRTIGIAPVETLRGLRLVNVVECRP